MKYSDIKLVILTAGKASRLYPLTFGFPKCLLSVNQKPEIFNMLNPMIREGLKDITFVVNLENKSLIESFMNHSFELLNLNIKYLVQDNFEGPAAAFKMIENDLDKPVMLLLGDTICEIPTELDKSWLGVSKVSEEKDRYCMVEYNKDKEITYFIDKSKDPMETDKAAIGIYYLKNYKLLKKVFN
ncbi:MAG: sugar phosphate nucleotidyltransferase, partial [Bacilli bacterium]|nr:sugar phosphate nucleotidyltransferase [Bacilli bacterium]